jgi:xanthine dehydrogenase accessory factor
MRDLLDVLMAWRAEGVGAGRAVVVRTFGSAPRPEGAVLLQATDGRLIGSVSGGCVEGAAAEEIERARQTGNARVIRYGISDEQAWDVGLACGGTIDVLVEPTVSAEIETAATRSIGPDAVGVAVATLLPADAPPAAFAVHQPGPGAPPVVPIVFSTDGSAVSGSSGDPHLDRSLGAQAAEVLADGRSKTVELAGRSWFVEAFSARPRLVIVGAVEVARSLVCYAAELGFETVVVDGRPAFATAERFPTADRIEVAWPDDAFETLSVGPNDDVAILSHDPKFDEPAIVEALRRGCRYVGAVGSKKTQGDRRERLREAGVADADLARLRGPIGLDLGGRSPAETALAIIAEIVAERHGGTGVPLRERARSIAAFSPEASVGV